ncbi:hypothetical protein CBL_09307 [Carabus blaptoides fortunei]
MAHYRALLSSTYQCAAESIVTSSELNSPLDPCARRVIVNSVHVTTRRNVRFLEKRVATVVSHAADFQISRLDYRQPPAYPNCEKFDHHRAQVLPVAAERQSAHLALTRDKNPNPLVKTTQSSLHLRYVRNVVTDAETY